MFVFETALALKARGHEVRVYAPDQGEIDKTLRSFGIHVYDSLAKLEWKPEIIHGQHHLQTMTALARFPAVPALYYCHGSRPWVEAPPLHRRILRYVTMAPVMMDGLAARFRVPVERLSSITNSVDLARFKTVRVPEGTPTRAVIFGNSPFREEELAALETACAENGLELDKIGLCYGTATHRPEHFLPRYDIAFAAGRSALEAMASGCAAFPVLPGMAGHLITPENFASYAHRNFSTPHYHPASAVTREWIQEQLSRYTPEGASAVTQKVRAEHTLERAVDRLLAIYGQVLEEARSMRLADGEADLRDVVRYLEWATPEYDRLWSEFGYMDFAKVAAMEPILEDLKKTLENKEKYIVELLQDREALAAKLNGKNEKMDVLRGKQSADRLRFKCAEAVLSSNFLGRHFLRKIRRMIKTVSTDDSNSKEPT
jgi:hypothetical protein